MEYNDYVVRNVLANNRFGITEVNNVQSINSLYLVREEFPVIEKLLQSHDIKALQNLPENEIRTGEYLDIMSFEDQNSRFYIVVLYDSDALEQDPQVVEIYSTL